MCLLSRNLGSSTSCNPQSLSRPVLGLFYLFALHTHLRYIQSLYRIIIETDFTCV